MDYLQIKSLFQQSVADIAADRNTIAADPARDFTRKRKLPPEELLSFLVTEGAGSTRNEMLDFFLPKGTIPSQSAMNQQREKLGAGAMEALFHLSNKSFYDALRAEKKEMPKYHYIGADGSTIMFFSKPKFASDKYFVSQGHSQKGFYNMHINAFYDLLDHTYTGALIQPVHEKDEFLAFCTLVDNDTVDPDTKYIYIGDRGYASYNNMAHVIEKGQFFVFRTKDIHSKGLAQKFDYPEKDTFDVDVTVTLVRSHSKKVEPAEGYVRFVDCKTSFDYIEYGSTDTYTMSFRVVRFPLSEGTYECILTNLPRDEFPIDRIKAVYFARWTIETSFRKLKYTIGLSYTHSYKPEFVEQEIWARLIAYNLTERLINQTVVEQGDTKHTYQVKFTSAVVVCKAFLRQPAEKPCIDVPGILKKELKPIRKDRQYPRLTTAHFRNPKHFFYRAA